MLLLGPLFHPFLTQDGFFSCGYIPPLADALTGEGLVLVQAMLRSAYRQYGISSLDDDVSDIKDLIRALRESEGIARVVLMGHSTGCQDICHLVRTVTEAEGPTGVQGLGIAGAILQVRGRVQFMVRSCA